MKLNADPKDQRGLAIFLTEFNLSLAWKNAALVRASERLGKVWSDERFREFDKKLADATLLIREFEARSKRFADYLNAKAFAGEKYLRR